MVCPFESWVLFVNSRIHQPGELQRIRFLRTDAQSRCGTAATEMAIAMPLLITLVFGSIEIANAVFLRQSLNMAAYEAESLLHDLAVMKRWHYRDATMSWQSEKSRPIHSVFLRQSQRRLPEVHK